jgi:HEAT repeat protein
MAVSAMLRNKDFYRRHLAARTAGNLRLAGTWDGLRELLASDSPALSLAAARALAQIDAARAVPLLMPQLAGRGGWHRSAAREILHLAGAGHVVKPLLHAVATAPADKLPQLIRLLAEIAPGEAAPLISRFLAIPADDENLLNACLDALNSPGDLEVVRALARHANWHVRVHAAKALGRLATREDEVLLIDMLEDSQWWVRYRAAQALSQLPGMNFAELLQIKDTRADRDARDMLHHVMAERELRENLTAPRHG